MASENFSRVDCTMVEVENSAAKAQVNTNSDFFVQDCQQIKEILSEISESPMAEVKPAHKFSAESDTESIVTEPNDSPFRVRRVSRSFSISHAPTTGDELFCSDSCDEEGEEAEMKNISLKAGKKSRFLLLRRSRSLGNIFTADFGIPRVKYEVQDVPFTEQVEAVEVEVLSKDGGEDATTIDDLSKSVDDLSNELNQRVSISALLDDDSQLNEKRPSQSPIRPQTSPPALLNAPLPGEESEASCKTSILDRMQKSLGFFFRCARRGSNEAGHPGLPKTPNSTPKSARVRTRAIELPNATFSSVVSTKASSESSSPPVSPIQVNTAPDASSFITKVDAPPMTGIHRLPIRSLPTFHDVSGPKGPLLPPLLYSDYGKKCLVLDLDETLVHSSFHIPDAFDLIVPLSLPDGGIQNIYVAKRPGVDEFLSRVGEVFEVVIFTASLARYADPVVDFLSEGMRDYSQSAVIKHRLYRESCLYLQGLYVKDLGRLGRDLSQTVIVDNSPASFLLQPDHGIHIKSWFSDTSDCELNLLLQSLHLLASSPDVHSWKALQ